LGVAISGASVLYNAPTATISRTITKALTSVTTAADGSFTISNLQSGSYTIEVIPPTTTSGTTTSVNNLAYITSATIPTVSSTQLNSTTAVVNAGTITLPRLGGTISGVAEYQAVSNATPVPINAKTLTIDLSSGPYSSYWYPTYSATTKAITITQYITTTTSATGAFTFSNMPMISYGGSGTSYVASSNYPILIDLGTGSAVSGSTVSLVTTYFPEYVKLGYAGTTGTATYSDPCIATTSDYPTLKFLSTSTTDSTGNTDAYSLLTSGSPTPIVLTFNNTLSTSLPVANALYNLSGTEVLATLTSNKTSTQVADTVTVSGATLTITPTASLVAGITYTVAYSVTDGKSIGVNGPLTGSFTFTTAGTYPTLALLTSSTTDAYGNINTLSVSAPIVLTFNNALSSVYATTNALTDVNGNPAYAYLSTTNGTAGKIAAPATISGNILTITPAVSLNPNTTYYVYYAVTDGVTKFAASPLTGNFLFGTAASTTAPVAITNLAVSTSALTGITGATGVFNSGASQNIPVSFTYNANYTYTEYYATTAAGVQGAWSDINPSSGSPFIITPANVSGTTAYTALYCPAFTSGQSVSIKLVESSTATNSATSTSNVLTIADTVNPTSFTLGGSNAVSSTSTTAVVSGGNNAAGTTATTLVFTFALASNEVQTLPAVTVASTGSTSTTTLAASNIVVARNTAGTLATVTVTVPGGDNFATSTLSVVLADGAGNTYEGGGSTTATPVVVTINP
jgi:hypothetical protein